jgi:hypothetical protein
MEALMISRGVRVRRSFFVLISLLTVMTVGCDWFGGKADEGDPCSDETQGESACDGNKIIRCSDGKWVEDGKCKTNENCFTRNVVDDYGADSTMAFCVDEDGAGDYCGDVPFQSRQCSGQIILQCNDMLLPKWYVVDECTLEQQCVDRELIDEYGDSTWEPFCVNGDGSGDYCGDIGYGAQKCSGQAILKCEDMLLPKWYVGTECTTEQQCVEETIVDDYGNASQIASCK